MSEILFIRHPETDMAGTFCGHSDPEVNERGRTQLAELIDRLGREDIGAVFASDLRRAQATGKAIAKAFGVDWHARSSLREIGFGQWEGLTWKDIERRDEAYSRRWIAEYPRLSAPGGERFRDFERRVLDEVALLSVTAESKGRNIAVVTHAGVLRIVLCALQDHSVGDAWEQTRSYCSIVRHTSVASPFAQATEVRP
jgi:alpha-ribazole phosphatase